MSSVLLHGAAGAFGMAAPPLFAAAVGLTVAAVFAWYCDVRFGVMGAAVGGLLLAAGLSGDLISHAAQDDEQARLLGVMAVRADPLTAARLHAMQDDEGSNPWHLLTGGGEGLLIGGLAGACLVLWRRAAHRPDAFAVPDPSPRPVPDRADVPPFAVTWTAAADLSQQAVERSAAWPMPPLAPVPVSRIGAQSARPPTRQEASVGRRRA